MNEPEFQDLPPETRKFLRELRPEEIRLLTEAIALVKSMQTVGRFVKWSIITVAGTFIAAAALGDSIAKIWHWVGGGR